MGSFAGSPFCKIPVFLKSPGYVNRLPCRGENGFTFVVFFYINIIDAKMLTEYKR